jgi:hypothetical protein
LRRWLSEAEPTWECTTVPEAGWAAFKNGVLLRQANQLFDVLITADQGLSYQQNFSGLTIAVLVFPSNRIALVREAVGAMRQSLVVIAPAQQCFMRLESNSTWTDARLNRIESHTEFVQHIFSR